MEKRKKPAEICSRSFVAYKIFFSKNTKKKDSKSLLVFKVFYISNQNFIFQKLKKEVRVHKNRKYFIDLSRKEKRFKPGYPYEVTAIVRNYDKIMATDRLTYVNLEVRYFYKPEICTYRDDNAYKSYDLILAKTLTNGIADFNLDVPANTTAISIHATYCDAKQTLNIKRHDANSREYLVLKSLTAR